MSDKLEKWIKCFKVICCDVSILATDRYIFYSLHKMISSNSDLHKPSYYYDYLSYTYGTYAQVAIRRQLKGNKFLSNGHINPHYCKRNRNRNEISLARLLSEIHDTPEVLSKSYYISISKSPLLETTPICMELRKKVLQKDFANLYGGHDKHIAPEMVMVDLIALSTMSSNIECFVDKRLAHRDTHELDHLPTYYEINGCITLLNKLCCKYLGIFSAESYDTLEKNMQHNWTQIFTIPWIVKQD